MIAITGAKVFTMDDAGIINHGLVIVEGNHIVTVGRDVDIPAGCEMVNAEGKYLFPGFIDAHTHIGLEEEIYRVEGDDVNETSEPLTPQLRAMDGINYWDMGFSDALRGGVTRSMCMPGSANIIGGQAVFLKHLAESEAEMVYKSPWGLKAALGENPKRVYGDQKKSPITRMANASILREAFYTAAKNMEKNDLPAAEMFRQEPLRRVLRGEMPLMLHVHRADDILTALRVKQEFGFDLILQHGTEALKVADQLMASKVPVCLGPLLINRAKVELKDVSFKNARLLVERGVKISLVTDHPVIPIEHLRVCAALAVREGLDEMAALKALTLWPAEILNTDHELGSISVGKKADLVIYNGHPLDFRSRVEKVMVDGRMWGGILE